MKPILLRLHRWITLVFALPLAVVLITGLILSFEPIAQTLGVKPGSLDLARVETLLAEHDKDRKAQSLALRAYENTLSIGFGRGDSIEIDLKTGKELDDDGWLYSLFSSSRGLHEHLIFDLGWLVTASTIAMLVLIPLGLLMGWPRLRNSVSGWHQGMAWFALPLVILSPLTGLALVYGITFAGAPGGQGPRPAALPLVEAVRQVAAKADLSNLVWLRSRGGRQLARINEGGEYRIYAVTASGLQPAARNWPRLIHEGNWWGVVSGLVNVVTSFVLIGLMGTGLWIWARRKLRRRAPQRQRSSIPAAAE